MGKHNESQAPRARHELSPRNLERRTAIARAACSVFGREGYTRASVDLLAAEAGVSTRTLYNHFPGGKAQLFHTVVTWSLTEVRNAQSARVHAVLDPQHPPHRNELSRCLIALARAIVGLMSDYPNHFALARHIHTEADHVPPEILRAWLEAGSEAAGGAVADAMAHLGKAALLDVRSDPALAATHFCALTSQAIVQQTHYGVLPLPQHETVRLITDGVAVFLRSYAATRQAGL